ncbi:MAG TPA: tetratricopeptide repeat protein [Nitrospirota bacterium]|nr:tetratricopeptide repeat protein [Nitrospirota bacterium]
MRTVIIIALLALTGCVTTGGNTVDKSKMAEGYYDKGLAYFQQKNFELASVEFNRSIQTDSSFKQSYYSLGLICDMQGRYEDSIKYYKKAISLDDKFSEAYNALGGVYSKQQKWDDAIENYQKALQNKLYATPHVPYLNMGRVYMAKKDYPKAVEAYRSAKQYANLDFIVLELATALADEGKNEEAINEYREGVDMAPQNPDMRYGLALVYLKDGNKKSAVQEFKKVVELAPKSDLAVKASDYLKTLR